jgi:nucleotide-binding universal stress UspA family protein
MSRVLIIGYDGSENGDDALALGAVLAERLAARPLVVTVIAADPHRDHLAGGENLEAAWREGSRRILAAARDCLGEVEAETRAIDDDFPAHALRDVAEGTQAIMIVLGSAHRSRLGRLLVGSVGPALLSDAPCPIAVAPRGYATGERRLACVGVAIDGSDESWPALDRAGELAARLDASLAVLGVVGSARSEWEMGRALDRAIDRVPAGLAAERHLMAGDPARLIAEAAADLDLLFVGSRGHGPIRSALLGSVSAKLIEKLPCPVLVVPRGAAGAQTRLPDGGPDVLASQGVR